MKIFKKRLISLLVLVFLFKIFLFFVFCDQPLNIVDEHHYNKLALSLFERGEFGWAPGKLTAIRPPLYPAFLCVIYRIFGPNSHNWVRFIQILISLASGFLVYLLAKRLFRQEKIALFASLFFLFYPSLIIFNYLILTETLFIFLFLLALLFLISAIFVNGNGENKKSSFGRWKLTIYLLVAGIFWGLASLTRSVTYPLVPLVGLFLFFIWPKKRQWVMASFIFVIAVTLTLAPWMIRNYRVFGHFIAVDTMGGLNLYMGNYDYTPLHRAWAAVDNPSEIAWYRGHEKELHGLNEAEKQRWTIKEALEFMKKHPGLTALRTLIKTANFWQLERAIIAGMRAGYFPALRNRALEIFIAISIFCSYVFITILGVSGLIWRITVGGKLNVEGQIVSDRPSLERKLPESIWHSLRFVDWLIILIILYFTGIHAIVFGHSRYHLPLIPVLCIYASFLGCNFRKLWLEHREHFWRVFVPVCMIFGCFWGYDIFIGSKDKILALIRILL